MPKRLAVFLCAVFLAAAAVACVRTVRIDELTEAVAAQGDSTMNSVEYMGDKDGYHYFYHSLWDRDVRYRVPVSDLDMRTTFPLTRERVQWRTVKRSGDPWPLGEPVPAP